MPSDLRCHWLHVLNWICVLSLSLELFSWPWYPMHCQNFMIWQVTKPGVKNKTGKGKRLHFYPHKDGDRCVSFLRWKGTRWLPHHPGFFFRYLRFMSDENVIVIFSKTQSAFLSFLLSSFSVRVKINSFFYSIQSMQYSWSKKNGFQEYQSQNLTSSTLKTVRILPLDDICKWLL